MFLTNQPPIFRELNLFQTIFFLIRLFHKTSIKKITASYTDTHMLESPSVAATMLVIKWTFIQK